MNKFRNGLVPALLLSLFLFSCGETKRIVKGNYLFRYADNQKLRLKDDQAKDSIYVYKVDTAFYSKIEDKTSFLILKNEKIKASLIDTIEITPPNISKIALNNFIYAPETMENKYLDEYKKSFIYTDFKFAIQTLSIPIKFRRALDDGTKYPENVETGVNIGLAPVFKYNVNVFNSKNKIMGKPLNQYSLNSGFIFNVGATELKGDGNAPGIKSARKSGVFSYGTFLMFGVNNFNFGYAIGRDRVMGEGSKHWVYQNKTWHGIIVALDIIKP